MYPPRLHKMLSKILRKKRQLNPNKKHIIKYQLIKGFTRCPVSPDGDCFYTATGFFCGLNADEMRQFIMSYFLFKKAEYSIFFESQDDLISAIKVNNKPGVWNSYLCDIAPYATAQALKRSIIIYNYYDKKINKIRIPVDEDVTLYPPLHLFRSYNHYEILLDNNKKPNKNIYPLPDVSEFYRMINLSSFEEEEEPEIEYNNEECIIRI